MSSKSVLIVDDEVHMRFVLERKLGLIGLGVLTASDGEEAYATACAHRPNLIISDCQMPRLTGIQMCVRLKENPKTADIPVLMVTGHGYRISHEERSKTNIREILPKPFSVRELLDRVARILSLPSL